MSRIRDLVVLLTCVGLLAVASAMFVLQRAEQAVVIDALTRLKAAEAALDAQRIAIAALAAGQRSNGEADAKLFSTVAALEQAVTASRRRDAYRYGVLVDALGAGR